jgi:DNA-binding response OmpR family regulator
VAVRGAPSQGTSVTVYLPCVAPPEAPANGEAAPRGGSETILVVDPDGPVRGAVGAVLRELGYCVLDASSGEAAVREAQRTGSPVRLVLADVLTPGLRDGAVLEQLSHADGSPRVLWMSGEPDGLGGSIVEPLLRKAFSPAQLARRVRELLDR